MVVSVGNSKCVNGTSLIYNETSMYYESRKPVTTQNCIRRRVTSVSVYGTAKQTMGRDDLLHHIFQIKKTAIQLGNVTSLFVIMLCVLFCHVFFAFVF